MSEVLGERGGEHLRCLDRHEVADAVDRAQVDVGEPLAEPVAPRPSGSCSGHSTVVGTPMRCAGGCSASDMATVADPARYQPIDAVNAPGGP